MTTASKKNTRFIAHLFHILLIFPIILSGAGCTRAPQKPLRVGTHIWPGFEPLYLARDMNLYAPNSVRLVEYTAGSDGIRAFRAGAVDAVALTLDEALLLAETVSDMSIILVMDVSHGGDVILAQPSISTLRELKGKRVGLETTALGAYVLTRALQSAGMTPDDVIKIPSTTIEQERAFKEKRFDAVVTYDPFRTKLLSAGARQLFDSSQMPGEIVDVLIVKRSLMDAHKNEIDELVRGWFSALEFIQRDRVQAATIMATREGLGTNEFLKALDGLRFYDIVQNRFLLSGSDPALIATAERLGNVMVENRLLRRIPEFRGVIDDRFIKDTGQ